MIVVVVALTMSVGVAGAGITAATPLDEVKALDVLVPTILKPGPKRDAVAASQDELTKYLTSFHVYSATDLPKAVAGALKDQKEVDAGVSSFAAVDALVEPASPASVGAHGVTLFDAKGKSIGLTLLKRDDGSYALVSPPDARDNTLRAYVDEARSLYASSQQIAEATGKPSKSVSPNDLQHFTKKGGTWTSAPMPPPGCAGQLKKLAKDVFATEGGFLAEHDQYTDKLKDLADLDVPKGAKVTIAKQTDKMKFQATVELAKGKATIDQSAEVKIVTPCKDTL